MVPGSVLWTSSPVSRPWRSWPKLRSWSRSGTSKGGPWEAEIPFLLVADDPQAGQPRVHREPGDAHDVVVVPEQRRSLAHRVVGDRVLAGREDVLRPAVVGSGGQPAVQVHDRE